jgi:hypothetical protein
VGDRVNITWPISYTTIKSSKITVRGSATPGARLRVGSRTITVPKSGKWKVSIPTKYGRHYVFARVVSGTTNPIDKAEYTRKRPSRPGTACGQPSGQVLGAIRFSLGANSDNLDAEASTTTAVNGTHYVASPITGTAAIIVVTYKDDAAYLSGMKAVNGSARSLTDLPDSGLPTLPYAAERALQCAGG